jgi:hypothetical protein
MGRPSSGEFDTASEPAQITLQNRQPKIWAVIRVSSGNFLEMYDFMVFGYYAAAIGNAFFPSGNPFTSLMLSLPTFGAGFLMRPLGAIVLGAYTDRHGRRAGLILTLSLMSGREVVFSRDLLPGKCKYPVSPGGRMLPFGKG